MQDRIRSHLVAVKRSGRESLATARVVALLGLSIIACLPGCTYSSNREAGMALGSGIGALTGATIGQGSGHFLGGALIGALAGGATGGLIGHAEDMREQRDAAIVHAQYLESTGQVLTNAHVIRMVHSGLSDDVIIGTVKNSYGKYDLSPDATIELKRYGTSDQVILALQKAPKAPQPVAASYVASPPPPSVGLVVAPAPVMVYGRPRIYPGPGYPHRRW